MVGRDAHVVAARPRAEQPDVLERPRDTAMRDDVGAQRPDRLAFEADVAAGRRVDAGDHVEHRGLARPVRSDQADQLALAGDQVEIADGLRRQNCMWLVQLQHRRGHARSVASPSAGAASRTRSRGAEQAPGRVIMSREHQRSNTIRIPSRRSTSGIIVTSPRGHEPEYCPCRPSTTWRSPRCSSGT